MKEETAKEVLVRLFGLKDEYTYFETLEAMIEYALIRQRELLEIVTKNYDETIGKNLNIE